MFLLLLLSAAPAFAVEEIPATKAVKDALYQNLTSNLACRCGCGTTLKTCPHETCSFAIPARKEIRGFIDQGLGREEIKAKMVSLHGEAILAQPTFAGFNVLGWVTPFVGILIFGYLVALTVRRWTSQRVTATGKTETTQRSADPYLEKMREELKKFEE